MNRKSVIPQSAVLSMYSAALFLTSVLAFPSFAQYWGGCRMRGLSYVNASYRGIPSENRLTAAQQRKISRTRSDLAARNGPLALELRATRAEADAYASRDGASRNKVKAYVEQIGEISNRIEENSLRARREINGVLTKEQRPYYENTVDTWCTDYGRTPSMSYGAPMYGMGMCPMMW